ncbi:hypothetical protein K2173_013243 [Erythroxylum novogranatense]|uniref:tRNA(Ile)-lysidine synthetase n=1 Tax=Erythroxylum novogranatense TaxID=1862640 RepID=A0AAV8SCS0_9ROSI|nr:hypothetical protein K2173_013243 [Erythroxylum novogranatense]
MARGLILSPTATASCNDKATSSLIALLRLSRKNPSFSGRCYRPCLVRGGCCFGLAREYVAMAKYKEDFSMRMAMAGLQPHHRIALGVSGGPDSMALCYLTASWKKGSSDTVSTSDDSIDGLLAIIVDHGLRAESKDEAGIVSGRVSKMGIRNEIAHCSWPNGRPKQGHLQEDARNMRYQIFQDICMKHQISVLLIAHHADDQAELFILRLSRNSGVLGLAGMAFTSQVFLSRSNSVVPFSKNEGILIVRPLLYFSKEDLYEVCQAGTLEWVEDPTNQSLLYARNRIRTSLRNLSSCTFQSELQSIITACRKTRAYVDHICRNLINHAVMIMDQGYAVVDLEILDPSKLAEMCLSKFISLVLQFISQRHRPVRGSTSKLLLNYFCTFPCKTSFTAAGCYLCPAPGSKGTKVLVCCSVDCPLSSNSELFHSYSSGGQRQNFPSDIAQIVAAGKTYSDHFVPDAADAYFLDVTSRSVLAEAKRLNIISESTYGTVLLLQRDEIKYFRPQVEDSGDHDLKDHNVDHDLNDQVETTVAPTSESLLPGQSLYFMNRFLVTWEIRKDISVGSDPEKDDCDWNVRAESRCHLFCSCKICDDLALKVRHMIEPDWLYLGMLSKSSKFEDLNQQKFYIHKNTLQIPKESVDFDYLKLSAQKALQLLKHIPVAARRSLPVLVNCGGYLLSIPSIGFSNCPCLEVSCEFKPKVPLGGGHSSFL